MGANFFFALTLIRLSRQCDPSSVQSPTAVVRCLQVYENFTPGDGLQTSYDWLVLFCSMLGSKFFGMGCLSLYILGNNQEYAQQLADWKAKGQLGKKPRHAF